MVEAGVLKRTAVRRQRRPPPTAAGEERKRSYLSPATARSEQEPWNESLSSDVLKNILLSLVALEAGPLLWNGNNEGKMETRVMSTKNRR